MTSVKQARAELQKLKEIVRPKGHGILMRIHGESDADALARYGLNEWPDGALFVDIHPDELGV